MTKCLRRIFLFLIYAFLYAPIIVLIVFSFNEGQTRGAWEGFSLRWYQSLVENEEILAALKNTLSIAFLATLIGTIIGTFGTLGVYYFGRRTRLLMNAINQVIVLNPDIVTAIGFMALFGFFQLIPGYLTILLAHIAFVIPYVVLSIVPRLQQMPRELPEAAMDLGATPAQTLRYVILPFLKSGIISGALMGFTMSIDDFVITFFNTGNGVETVSTMVYSMARRGINPEVNALSTLLFVAMFALLFLTNWRAVKGEEVQ
ncbi:MAG: ABC transporter permease [Peptoniphilaceae bacterium]|nr:ABC transporter permease [Peptoniphilaceae bacterium]MDY6085439.1 ABC transporter permease [Peptoniphilaceae bacterium]